MWTFDDTENLGNTYNGDNDDGDDDGDNENKGDNDRIDFVLVSKNDGNKESDKRRENYFYNLRRIYELDIIGPIQSKCGHQLFYHIHAPFESLCEVAEELKFRLPTKEEDCNIETWFSKLKTKISTKLKSYNPFIIKRSVFTPQKSYFTDVFDQTRLNEFINSQEPDKLFTQTNRSGLVAYMLEKAPFETRFSRRHMSQNKEMLGKSSLLKAGVFIAAYPVHDSPLVHPSSSKRRVCSIIKGRQKLHQEWANMSSIFKYQPIEAIKSYFGEKVGFYFAWIGFYTTYLLPASIFGIICILYGAVWIPWYEPIQEICSPQNETTYYMCPLCDRICSYYSLKTACVYAKSSHLFDNEFTIVFALFMSIWSVFFVKFWKRTQSSLAYHWHMLSFREEQSARPQYTASARSFKSNPVTGEKEPFRSQKESFIHVIGTISVVLFFMALIISTVIGVIVYRAAIFAVLLTASDDLRENSKIFVTGTAATINLIVINLLKVIYEKLAVLLTNWENPRTRTSFEKSFAIKMFWFSFCNTYSSIFYVAFFKNEIFVGWPGSYKRFGDLKFRLEGCSAQGCFLELCIQIVVLMVGQQLFSCCTEVLIPFLKQKYHSWKNAIRLETDVPIWEADYNLEENDNLSIFWLYQKVALQYGFVTMFVAAFPLAPLIAFVTNLLEIRIQAINMIITHRRPIAYRADGIGVFREIMVTLTGLGLLINSFVIAISSDFIPKQIYKYEYSVDGTLKGYVDWSLSTYNVSHFKEFERPDNPMKHIKIELSSCRFPGFHQSSFPNDFNEIHWKIMTYRLAFAFLFYFTVTFCARLVQILIPQKSQALYYKLKRQEYLNAKTLQIFRTKWRRGQSILQSQEFLKTDSPKHDKFASKKYMRQRSQNNNKLPTSRSTTPKLDELHHQQAIQFDNDDEMDENEFFELHENTTLIDQKTDDVIGGEEAHNYLKQML